MSDNIKIRIINKISDFFEKEGFEPSEIHLTTHEEMDLMALSHDDIGNASGRIFEKGARVAISEAGGKLFGKKVVWDSESFEVK